MIVEFSGTVRIESSSHEAKILSVEDLENIATFYLDEKGLLSDEASITTEHTKFEDGSAVVYVFFEDIGEEEL